MVRPAGILAIFLLAGDCVRAEPPDFVSDVRPIFERYCTQCHGAQVQMGELDLRTPALMRMGGTRGPALVPGSPHESLLYQRIIDKSMPMGEKKVPATERDVIRRWLEAGAPGAGTEATQASAETSPSAHWAFQTPRRPSVPGVSQPSWVRTPVDAFVLARLDQKGIRPAPPADRRTLLRRAYLTLIGLPPTPEEVQAFLEDESAEALDRVVEDLLGRPHYGERWARHWLDAVRYAETNGYERDSVKPNAWRYRDYVIDAFNSDKPFARFLTEQLAGDEVEGSTAETMTAATFLRLGNWDDEPADEAMSRYDQLDDVLGVTATVFLGLTLRCARCHDHKFEPFSQQDYYRMLAVFEPLKRPQFYRSDLDHVVGTEEQLAAYRAAVAQADAAIAPVQTQFENLSSAIVTRIVQDEDRKAQFRWFKDKKLQEALNTCPTERNEGQKKLIIDFEKRILEEICNDTTREELSQLDGWKEEITRNRSERPAPPSRAYVWYEDSANAPATRILQRGDPHAPGETVEPGIPGAVQNGFRAPIQEGRRSTGRRLWLARWMTHPDNPLVARVMVNRLWQWHFGEGLVASESDFGIMGQRPSHPELLDYLATEFIDSGWSIKHIQRLITNSATFRLSSAWDERKGRLDPDNRLLWRWRPRRLEAEAVRDSILAVSGRLNLEGGGPSVYPKLPRAVLEGQSRPGDGWGDSTPEQASRRSVYVFAKRTLAVPELEILDMPDNSSSCEQRRVSTTGPQALTFLNGDFMREQAGFFASRIRNSAKGKPEAQIRQAFRQALARPPSPEEIKASLNFLEVQQEQIQADGDPDVARARQRALKAFALTLLNANEFFYLN